MMCVGLPTGRYKSSTVVMLTRRPRSKWWTLVCFGQKGHYGDRGSCPHIEELAARIDPAKVPHERLRLKPFGDKDARTEPLGNGEAA